MNSYILNKAHEPVVETEVEGQREGRSHEQEVRHNAEDRFPGGAQKNLGGGNNLLEQRLPGNRFRLLGLPGIDVGADAKPFRK